MRQTKQILRGCFATYCLGVIVLLAMEIPLVLEGRTLFGLWDTLVIFVVYGGLLAAFITAAIIAVWAVLAKHQSNVIFPFAPGTAILLFGLPLMLGSGAEGAVTGLMMGTIAGTHFWIWAFGAQWRVKLHFGERPI